MDSYELTKFAGAILFSILVLFAINFITDALVDPRAPERLAYPLPEAEEETAATAAETTESEAATPAAATDESEAATTESLAALLAAGDAGAGRKIAKKCAACHSVDEGGKNKVGPNLYGILGDQVARTDGFKYSDALGQFGGTWSYETLDGFLTKPKEFLRGTKMAFAGLKKPTDRANLILYLRSLGDADMALPAE